MERVGRERTWSMWRSRALKECSTSKGLKTAQRGLELREWGLEKTGERWGPRGPQGSDYKRPWNYIRAFRLYVEVNRELMTIFRKRREVIMFVLQENHLGCCKRKEWLNLAILVLWLCTKTITRRGEAQTQPTLQSVSFDIVLPSPTAPTDHSPRSLSLLHDLKYFFLIVIKYTHQIYHRNHFYTG